MNCSKYLLSFLMLLSVSHQMNSQNNASNEKEAVNKVIIDLFDGMRSGDSAKVSSTFRKDVRMFTSYKKETGENVLDEGKLSDFLKAVGTPHEDIWNEKIWNTEIQIDGNIAQVWTDYAFFISEKFSHCGVDAFQLVKENDTWRIISLMDTRRVEGCEQD